MKEDTKTASQVSCASGYPTTLLQTVSGITVLRLAKHKVLCKTRIGLVWRYEYVPHPPLNSLQYAPIKNAALFKGALVAPSSLTLGIEAGRGAGSRKGWDEDSPGRKELIVVAAVGVVCALCERLRFGPAAACGPGHSHFWKRSSGSHRRDALGRAAACEMHLVPGLVPTF